MSISESIIAYRKRLGVSQEHLARALGISHITVYRWEKGLQKPGMENELKLKSIGAIE